MNQKLISTLLDCLHQEANRISGERLTALTHSEWLELLQTTSRQHVTGLLYHNLNVRGYLPAVPEEIALEMKAAYMHTVGRNLQLYGELKRIVQVFQEVSIPVIGLKGIVLADRVYDNLAPRLIGDLDLLVPRAQLEQAARLILALGYAPEKPYFPEVDTAVSPHLTPFSKKGVGSLELHWTITDPRKHYCIDEAELWERAVPARLGDTDILSLSPEDLLLHLCLHTSYQHQFAFGLRTICDIGRVIQHYDQSLDWEQVLARARRWNWVRGTYLALRVANETLGAAVPPQTMRALQLDGFPESLVATAIAQLFTDHEEWVALSPRLAHFMGERNLWMKLRELLGRIFVSRVVIAKYYSLAPDSPWLYWYYLVRVKDLLRRHGHKAWQLGRHDPQVVQLAGRTRDLLVWLSDA
jgi:hypothetical protein